MVVYSIKDLETLSGVKAHTIRIWEKRYDLIQPKRTATNIRYYTDEDLRKLLNVCFLYNKGYKISKISQMCPVTIKEKVSGYSKLNLSFEDKLDAMLIFILELDSYNFNKVFDQHISQKGLEQTMEDLIYPLLDKLGMAWMSGSFLDVHESFVTQIIKAKILYCTEKISEQANSTPCFMIYLPPNEKQELSLLYLHYILKNKGCKIINLGNEVNNKDLTYAIETCQPDYVFTILNEEIPTLLTTLENYPINRLLNLFIRKSPQTINGQNQLISNIGCQIFFDDFLFSLAIKPIFKAYCIRSNNAFVLCNYKNRITF